MKLILQRVNSASVDVEGKTVGKINRGLLIFLGITKNCTDEKIDWMARKILKVRIFPKGKDNFKESVSDIAGEILVISNFTIPGVLDANKPNFKHSADYEDAKRFYKRFISILKSESNLKIETGEFGGMMTVDSQLDGPFNLVLEK